MRDDKTIAIGADHGAYRLKGLFVERLRSLGYEPLDKGTDGEASCDYPDYAVAVAKAVAAGEAGRGILLCGSGIGMSIVANKVDGVRAALCHDHYTAKMSRMHNDANVLCVGARVVGDDVALDLLAVWLATPFEGGRHQRRVEKITAAERA
ncbi:MAG: ribose 5-phosphate isomerase B [Nitrospinae bacterium]|nr:ribose 5-phosphate isomerase B [Nitrospinota bacterium]